MSGFTGLMVEKGFTGLMLEKVHQLHLVVIIVNVSRNCINFIVLWVEMCFQTFDFKPFRFFKEARSWWRCLRPAESGGPWSSLWVQIHSLRKTVEVSLLTVHLYPWFHFKALQKPYWISLNHFVGEPGYTSLQDGLTYEDIQVGYLFNAFVMQYILNFHEWMHESF